MSHSAGEGDSVPELAVGTPCLVGGRVERLRGHVILDVFAHRHTRLPVREGVGTGQPDLQLRKHSLSLR